MSYNLEWRDTATLTTTQVTGITDLFYDLTGLTASEGYEFRVQEDDGTNTSAWSAWSGFTTASSSSSLKNFSLSEGLLFGQDVTLAKNAQMAVSEGATAILSLGSQKQASFIANSYAEVALSVTGSKAGLTAFDESATTTDAANQTKVGQFTVAEQGGIDVSVLMTASEFFTFDVAESANVQYSPTQIKYGAFSPAISSSAATQASLAKTGLYAVSELMTLNALVENTKVSFWPIDEQAMAKVRVLMGEAYKANSIIMPVTNIAPLITMELTSNF